MKEIKANRGDAMRATEAISNEHYNLAAKIKFQFNVAFDGVQLDACPRSCNTVGHTLAAQGVELPAGYFLETGFRPAL